jgi:hypothetical protein
LLPPSGLSGIKTHLCLASTQSSRNKLTEILGMDLLFQVLNKRLMGHNAHVSIKFISHGDTGSLCNYRLPRRRSAIFSNGDLLTRARNLIMETRGRYKVYTADNSVEVPKVSLWRKRRKLDTAARSASQIFPPRALETTDELARVSDEIDCLHAEAIQSVKLLSFFFCND